MNVPLFFGTSMSQIRSCLILMLIFCNMIASFVVSSVYAIREAATVNVKKLIEKFGVEWASVAVFPKVFAMARDPNYLHRLTTLFSINVIIDAVNTDTIVKSLLPATTNMAEDSVANVRFNVAKTLEKLSNKVSPDIIQNIIVPVLTKLGEDADTDVTYFAKEALQNLSC